MLAELEYQMKVKEQNKKKEKEIDGRYAKLWEKDAENYADEIKEKQKEFKKKRMEVEDVVLK